jgi:hypothetical protein
MAVIHPTVVPSEPRIMSDSHCVSLTARMGSFGEMRTSRIVRMVISGFNVHALSDRVFVRKPDMPS